MLENKNRDSLVHKRQMLNDILPLVVVIVCDASLAVEATVAEALSTTSLVRFRKPRIPCQALSRAPRTAVVVS